jgi:hypothetical protein
LPAGGHYDELRSVTIPASIAGGNYFLLYATDTTNSVVEHNESDNVVARRIEIRPNVIFQPPNDDRPDPDTSTQTDNAIDNPASSGPTTAQVRQQLLLLTLPSANLMIPATPAFGAAGTAVAKKQVTGPSLGMPQVVDAAFGSDEVDKTALLTNFLDFVEPEALVVDLGDEPPAKISVDVSKAAAVEVLKPADNTDKPPTDGTGDQSHSGASTNQSGGTIAGLEKPSDDKTLAAAKPVVATSFSSSLANNWKLFATGGGIVLLLGAAWTSRSKWVRIARKLRWR